MPADPFTIALAPLDERPVNTRYPQMIGAIAGVRVSLPPEEIRGRQRNPADLSAVADWLRHTGTETDGAVVSVEYLAYGNLIGSRTTGESVAEALPRLAVPEEIGRHGKPVYAFNLITRIPNADDCVEEPLYWCEYGRRLHGYSRLLHRRAANALTSDEREALERLEAEVPVAIRTDWLNRRLRNHTVNLSLIDLLARERIALLLITSDDTAEWGLASQEKLWLEHWLGLLAPTIGDRLLIHPGADEVGSALTARMICQFHGVRPTIHPVYAVPGGEEIIAPYEDRAVRLTVEGQIRACGAEVAPAADAADILLAVLPPSPRRTEFREEFAAAERADREPHYRDLFERMGEWRRAGRSVALGDVAYPNGSDPLAMERLLAPDSPVDPSSLAAYGGWNTAGNTLGTVVAQAVCSRFIGDDPARRRSQAAFLTHRFLEDYGYQARVRREARLFCERTFGRRDPDPESPEQVAAVCDAIASGLTQVLTERLQPRGIGVGLRIAPGSVRLPWRRTFEVDFTLTEE
ncbi:MAG: DUF4127 family protein [Capsulimonadales bacterium]|nr:DUF4127 family protein [Capsulimonadales bacterium]